MRRISKAEEQARVQALHHLLEQHRRPKADLRFWLIHVLHWHAMIVAAIAATFVIVSFMSGSSVDASSF